MPESNANQPFVGGQGPLVTRSQRPRPPARSVHAQAAIPPNEETRNLISPRRIYEFTRRCMEVHQFYASWQAAPRLRTVWFWPTRIHSIAESIQRTD